jgi:hypothetical protein
MFSSCYGKHFENGDAAMMHLTLIGGNVGMQQAL